MELKNLPRKSRSGLKNRKHGIKVYGEELSLLRSYLKQPAGKFFAKI